MLNTKYDVFVRNGKERFVVISEQDYKAMQERLEDDADYKAIEASKKCNAGKPLIPHEQVMREFGLTSGRKRRKA